MAQNFRVFDLPCDMKVALDKTFEIVKRMDADFPIEAVFKAKADVDGVIKFYSSRTLFIHRLENFKREILDEDITEYIIMDTNFDEERACATEIKLLNFYLETRSHVKERRVCPICSRSLSSKSFAKHFSVCSKGKGCSICQLVVPDGNVALHRETCGAKTYDCRLCSRRFSTGRARAEHEKKCRLAAPDNFSDSSSSKQARPSVVDNYEQETAIDGHFRIISLPVTQVTDHEGALSDLTDQIELILGELLGTGLKAYIVAEMKMRKLLEQEKTTECYFSSKAATFLSTTDKTAVLKQQIAGKKSLNFTNFFMLR